MSKPTEPPYVEEPEEEIDEELDAAIQEAIAQSERGEGIPWEEFRKTLYDIE